MTALAAHLIEAAKRKQKKDPTLSVEDIAKTLRLDPAALAVHLAIPVLEGGRSVPNFPVDVITDAKGKVHKTPAVGGWQKYFATEGEREESGNWGCTIPDGLLAIDIDTYKGATREAVEAILGPLDWDAAKLQTTIRGGEHYIFACSEALTQGSNVCGVDGFDTRTAGSGWLCTGYGYTPHAGPVLEALQHRAFPPLPAAAVAALAKPVKAVVKHSAVTIAEAREVFERIPVEVWRNQDTWLKIGMGTHLQFGGSEEAAALFFEFSERVPEYVGCTEENAKRWNSFGSDKAVPITWGTVDYYATGPIVGVSPLEGEVLKRPTHDNVAMLFVERMRGRLIYVRERGCWYEWRGTHWHEDKTDIALNFAREIARWSNQKGKAAPASVQFSRGVEAFARADRALAAEIVHLDRDNYLLNTPTGTVDLRTGEMRGHHPGDMITHCTTVGPSTEHGGVFDKFMQEITAGDVELVRFLQVALGSMLSGALEEHWIMFWTGEGRNGKNTLGDLVAAIFGTYAKAIPTSTLMTNRHEDHKTSIASLQGARLCVSSEVSTSSFWSEAKINAFTGDTTLAARLMGKDEFNFKRTHKHLVYGNHRPQLRGAPTQALRSRFKIVPFNVSFAGREDPMLPAKLLIEAGYVLSWLIEGHALWIANGRKLPVCATVEAETEDYFESQSTVMAWAQECVEINTDATRDLKRAPTSTQLYHSYKVWKVKRGELAEGQTIFTEALKKQYTMRPAKHANCWPQLTLVPVLGLPMIG